MQSDPAAQVLDVPAKEIQVGDDLFGGGRVTAVFRSPACVRVKARPSYEILLDPDEEVTVQRV